MIYYISRSRFLDRILDLISRSRYYGIGLDLALSLVVGVGFYNLTSWLGLESRLRLEI